MIETIYRVRIDFDFIGGGCCRGGWCKLPSELEDAVFDLPDCDIDYFWGNPCCPPYFTAESYKRCAVEHFEREVKRLIRNRRKTLKLL